MSHIPNLITLCNISAGSLAVVMAMENQLPFASALVILAALLDFFDGLMARLLHAFSDLGKQLDSFADLISFGMAPAAIAYRLMEWSLRMEGGFEGLAASGVTERIYLFSPIMLVLFAAIRLADFNIRDAADFRGLPTPAAGLFVAGLVLVLISDAGLIDAERFFRPDLLLGTILGLSLAMILPMPMFSLKFRGLRWKGNEIRYFFLAFSGILLILLQEISLPVIIACYLLLSLGWSVFKSKPT